MQVDITGRHIEITEPLRKFATDRIERMHGVIADVMEVHLVLTVEKHQRHAAEANIKTKHDFHHVQETSTDMYTSIAAVFDKVEKQLLRSKDKTITRKRHGTDRETEIVEPEV
jgi:putative sigma-54 modulation protein